VRIVEEENLVTMSLQENKILGLAQWNLYLILTTKMKMLSLK
jgi:hypothetical protein